MEQLTEAPFYWKTSLEDIADIVKRVKKGKVRTLSRSAGGRDIPIVEYGEKQDFGRTANYNSACGARNPDHYANKKAGDRPVLLIVGGIHGGELEGIAALLNLIQALETGVDLRGEKLENASDILNSFRLLLIPCMNPDGRVRVPVQTVVGMTYQTFRYYVQGTWKDGSLCDWPGCKAVHPILNDVEYLGGYFNDDGINMMHDNFFMPMAQETKALMQLVDEEAVDATVLLHGGTNCINHIINTSYVPITIKQRQYEFTKRLKEASEAKEIKFKVFEINEIDGMDGKTPSFNLTSTLHHISGGLSMTYETNMGLVDAPGEAYSYEEIWESHRILFEELFKFMREKK